MLKGGTVIGIEKPTLVKEIDTKSNYGKFTLEPLDRGYGTTLDNSMRRFLLSSLPGAAVTSVKIEGVLHEFSTIPGVKEDVTEIILNLKQLAVRMDGDEPQKVIINAVGPKEVTAEDIICGNDVEIINKDLHIATLDNNKTNLVMEINLAKGKGYVPAEQNKQDITEISVIPVDSIFTPVKMANYTVENTRVGKFTDFDKLTIEVKTDGSLTPQESIAKAARTMQEHLMMLISLDENTEAEAVLEQKVAEEYSDSIRDKKIDYLELSQRPSNCLKRAGITTVGELLDCTEQEIMKLHNLGKKSLDEIRLKLVEEGLSFRQQED